MLTIILFQNLAFWNDEKWPIYFLIIKSNCKTRFQKKTIKARLQRQPLLWSSKPSRAVTKIRRGSWLWIFSIVNQIVVTIQWDIEVSCHLNLNPTDRALYHYTFSIDNLADHKSTVNSVEFIRDFIKTIKKGVYIRHSTVNHLKILMWMFVGQNLVFQADPSRIPLLFFFL